MWKCEMPAGSRRSNTRRSNTRRSNTRRSNTRRSMKPRILAMAAAFLAGTTLGVPSHAQSAGDKWTIDSARSAVTFTIKHLMVSSVSGSFHDVAGTVLYDGKDLSKASVKASIGTGSIDTQIQPRDEHLRSKEILDAGQFPTIAFKSNSVVPEANGAFKIAGTLTMHGICHDVVLDASPLTPVVRDGDDKLRTGTTATAELNRKDFDVFVDRPIDHGGTVVGENVKVELRVALVKSAN